MVDLELTPSFPPVDEFRKPSDVFSEDKAIKLIKPLGNAKENEYVTPAGTYLDICCTYTCMYIYVIKYKYGIYIL